MSIPMPKNKNSKQKNLDENSIADKFKKINSELEIMKPETLLLNVDPSIEAREIIEQIQLYYSLIHKEMVAVKHEETEEKELKSNIKTKQEELEKLVAVEYTDYLEMDRKNIDILAHDKRKPTLDYKVKIRILEKELNYTYQNYNNTKAKNEGLKQQLNELRKNSLISREKVQNLTKELKLQEQNFKEQKEEVEKKIRNKEENELVKKITEGQKILRKNNDIMIGEIKNTDKDMTKKLAMKKYYDHEKTKLLEKEKKIILKWKNERKKFYEENAEEIKKYQSFDPTSKVLEILNEEKIAKLENMLTKIYEETNLNSIEALVDYFIKCTKEFNNFEDFIASITNKVSELEKEVEELEYIINFCEQNLEVKNDNNLDENEINDGEQLKKAGENFIHLQYYVILEKYKKFCEESMNVLLSLHSESLAHTDESDFTEFLKKNLQTAQETLRGLHILMKKKIKPTNQKPEKQNNIDFDEVDTKYLHKADKIKDSVKKEFEKAPEKGVRIMNLNKIKGIIEPLINEEIKKKK